MTSICRTTGHATGSTNCVMGSQSCCSSQTCQGRLSGFSCSTGMENHRRVEQTAVHHRLAIIGYGQSRTNRGLVAAISRCHSRNLLR